MAKRAKDKDVEMHIDQNEDESNSSNSESEGEEDHQEDQVRVKFITKLDEFRVSDTSIAVPASLGRGGLSKIINHLLGKDSNEQVPFDFLETETDVLVRGSLNQVITSKELSKENVITLEYSPALKEPELTAESEWPDWIACVKAKFDPRLGCDTVVSGTFDGGVQFSRLQGDGAVSLVGSTSRAHRLAVKSLDYFGDDFLVTGSKDGLVKLWQANLVGEQTIQTTQFAVLEGCSNSVEAVVGSRIGSHAVVVAGGWNHALCLFKVNVQDGASSDDENQQQDPAQDSRPVKKSRADSTSGSRASQKLQHVSTSSVFRQHSDQVSSLCWEDESNPVVVYSGSWDCSLRGWDLSRESCILELNCPKPVTSIAYNPTMQLLASAHPDNAVRVWDARTVGDAVVKFSFGSHKGWVSSLAWSPQQENLFASASHDHTVKVWDIRSSVPLYTLNSHSAKLYAVEWAAQERAIISGGADSVLRVHHIN